MTIVINKIRKGTSLLENVEKMSGVSVRSCLQCRKCTNGCPVTGMTKGSPSDIIRRLQLGADESILASDIVWSCAGCETCFSRCPMHIDMAAVMDALRVLSVRRNVPNQKGNVPLFNRWFLKTVRMFGRTYDLGTIAAYKVGTSSYLQDSDKVPAMLTKRKIAFLPSFGGNRVFVKRIFKYLSGQL